MDEIGQWSRVTVKPLDAGYVAAGTIRFPDWSSQRLRVTDFTEAGALALLNAKAAKVRGMSLSRRVADARERPLRRSAGDSQWEVLSLVTVGDSGWIGYTEKADREEFARAFSVVARAHGLPGREVQSLHGAPLGLFYLSPSLAAQWDSAEARKLLSEKDEVLLTETVWWRGACGHRWADSVHNRLEGDNCPLPSCEHWTAVVGRNDLTTLEPDLAAEWHRTRNAVAADMVEPRAAAAAWWRAVCGHEWSASPSRRTQRITNDRGCPFCLSRDRVVSGAPRLIDEAPWLAQQFVRATSGASVGELLIDSDEVVTWRSPCGHERETTVSKYLKLPHCTPCLRGSRPAVDLGPSSLSKVHPRLAREWHPGQNDLKPSQVPAKSTTAAHWRCAEGHEWRARISNRVGGAGCPTCSPASSSAVERALSDQVAALGVRLGRRSVDVPWGARRTADCDIVLGELGVIVEYDGSRWHEDRSRSDVRKTLALIEAGWAVIRVREAPLPPLEVEHERYAEVAFRYDLSRVKSLAAEVVELAHRFASSSGLATRR